MNEIEKRRRIRMISLFAILSLILVSIYVSAQTYLAEGAEAVKSFTTISTTQLCNLLISYNVAFKCPKNIPATITIDTTKFKSDIVKNLNNELVYKISVK